MDTSTDIKFDIHLVKIFDVDEDTLSVYFEVVEDDHTSHGLFSSPAEAEQVLNQLTNMLSH